MVESAPIDPNHQLRWAIEHLPSPAAGDAPEARVSAPALTRAGAGEAPEISVAFRRSRREVEGASMEGWEFEGAVLLDARDTSVESGYPGTRSWLVGKLGPYCLDLEVLREDGASALVRAFATTRDILDGG
ncbi:MAG: hypothetical protein WKG00_01140 [Polyangiaceae bacterium]